MVLCALAPSVLLLIAARILQAAGAAMFIANSSPISMAVFPPSQRGRVLGIQATTVYLGLAIGAPLGGFLADQFGWQSVFLIPIPFAAIALLVSWQALRVESPPSRRERFDLVGAGVYLVGLIVVLLALNRGRSWGWTSELTIGCLVLGAMLLTAFVIHERRTPSPMLNLSLFSQRAFTAPVISSMLNYAAAAGTIFILPFALIQGRGLSPSQVGLVLTSQPIVMAVMASVSGALSDKIGSRIPATVGMSVLALGLFLLSWIDLSTPLPLISAGLAVVGLGIGLFTSPNNSAVLGAVGPERRGVASGILSTARTLGNVLGIGATGAVYATVLADHRRRRSGQHRPGDGLRPALRQLPCADRRDHVGHPPEPLAARPVEGGPTPPLRCAARTSAAPTRCGRGEPMGAASDGSWAPQATGAGRRKRREQGAASDGSRAPQATPLPGLPLSTEMGRGLGWGQAQGASISKRRNWLICGGSNALKLSSDITIRLCLPFGRRGPSASASRLSALMPSAPMFASSVLLRRSPGVRRRQRLDVTDVGGVRQHDAVDVDVVADAGGEAPLHGQQVVLRQEVTDPDQRRRRRCRRTDRPGWAWRTSSRRGRRTRAVARPSAPYSSMRSIRTLVPARSVAIGPSWASASSFARNRVSWTASAPSPRIRGWSGRPVATRGRPSGPVSVTVM